MCILFDVDDHIGLVIILTPQLDCNFFRYGLDVGREVHHSAIVTRIQGYQYTGVSSCHPEIDTILVS
jgi:hypothetical protein